MSEPFGTNTAFSQKLPSLQLAWDSTSLGALKDCPQKYFYSIVQGWIPRHTSVHLTFGLHYHAALERYDHAKSAGRTHEEAVESAVRYALEITWDRRLGRPWISGDSNKNRLTLVRTVVWYLDQFANDPLQTVQLASGKPAVELSFRVELGLSSDVTGEAFLLCGHLDRLATMPDGSAWIVDRKTSKHQVTDEFFDKFSPDNQMSCYTLGAKIGYGAPVHGLIIDAAQVAVTFSRFQRGIVQRPESVTDEWYEDLGDWLGVAEGYAKRGKWPHNDKACHHYFGCDYRSVCSKSPVVREQWLAAGFTQRTWDPLKVRGDI